MLLGGITGIIIVALTIISTFHLLGPDKPTVVVVLNDNKTGGQDNVTLKDDGNHTTVIISNPTFINDDFFSDNSLNPQFWTINGPHLQQWAKHEGDRLVSPTINFQPLGMEMSGTSDQFDVTGIESAYDYAPPFTITTSFQNMGSGDAVLELKDLTGKNYFIVGGASSNGCGFEYQTQNDPNYIPIQTSYDNTPNWCSIKISIDALGTGTATLEDKVEPISIGKGPFYLIIGQELPITPTQQLPIILRYVHMDSNSG